PRTGSIRRRRRDRLPRPEPIRFRWPARRAPTHRVARSLKERIVVRSSLLTPLLAPPLAVVIALMSGGGGHVACLFGIERAAETKAMPLNSAWPYHDENAHASASGPNRGSANVAFLL